MSHHQGHNAPEKPEPRRGRYVQKIVLGLLLIAIAFICLWYGSPVRTGDALQPFVWGFIGLFAVGFIFLSMGLMGAEDDYPALLSGFVLYFIVGALIAVILYIRGGDLSPVTLGDVDSADFWRHWLRVAATWPFELIARAGILGFAPW